jgi:nucleoside-diphosphate-sugar epimerase
MENDGFPRNPYIESKIALRNYLELRPDPRLLHIQLHTLYGVGAPSPFMFLGQLLEAIRDNEEFEMSSGLQLREFHHVTDEAHAVQLMVQAGLSGTHLLSHGNPAILVEIATSIFSKFGRPEKLKPGAKYDQDSENYSVHFHRHPEVSAVLFRETFRAIEEYLRECLCD